MDFKEIPKWVFVAGGLSIVALSAWTGSNWGAWMVILIVLSMLAYAQNKGVLSYGN